MFNVAYLSHFVGDFDDEANSMLSSFQEGEDDACGTSVEMMTLATNLLK